MYATILKGIMGSVSTLLFDWKSRFLTRQKKTLWILCSPGPWSLLSLWKNFSQATILATFWHCWAPLACMNTYNWTSGNHSWTSFVISHEWTCSDSKKEYTMTWFQLFYIAAVCNVNMSPTLLLKNRLLPNRLLARIWKMESTMCFRAYSNEYFRRQHEK